VPVNKRVWPLAVNLSPETGRARKRGTPSNAVPRFNAPIPWLGTRAVPLPAGAGHVARRVDQKRLVIADLEEGVHG